MNTTPAKVLLADGRMLSGLHVIEDGVERFAYVAVKGGQQQARILSPGQWVAIYPQLIDDFINVEEEL